jgi:hypothetical protein
MPAFVELMFGNFRLLFAGFAVLSAAVFVSSVALLHRKNWARIAFIAFLTLGIAWNIGALVLQQMMFAAMPALSTGAPPEFRNGFETMWTVMRAFSFVVAIALSIVFAWLITRLASGAVRREFRGSLWRS